MPTGISTITASSSPKPAYRTFLLRSVVGAALTSLICLLYAWPVAYFIARHGGRYRLLLVLLLAAPFFTGVILRIAALQGILGPGGLINMALGMAGFAPITAADVHARPPPPSAMSISSFPSW